MESYNEPAPRTPTRPRVTFDIQSSPSGNDFAPFRREDDIAQLSRVYSALRAFIRETYTLDEAATEVRNLDGHQDLKDMIPENMGYVDRLRRLADMLELIQNKLDNLRAQNDLEQIAANETMSPIPQEDDSGGYGTTDTEPESDSDEDDLYVTPPRRLQLPVLDSDDESDGEVARMLGEDDDSDEIIFSSDDDDGVSTTLRF